MANLATRQKIILGVMGLVLLYAAFELLAPKPKAGVDIRQKSEELNAFVTSFSAQVAKDSARGGDAALAVSRAEKGWAGDPFLGESALRAWANAKEAPRRERAKAAAAAPKVAFSYAGYIEVGQKRMAVINGSEYREGEALDVKGYVLRSVSPARVVIFHEATQTTETVPLQE